MKTLDLGIIALAFACFSGPLAAAAQCALPENAAAMTSEMAQGVNANRQANGLSALSLNEKLNAAALAHACDMAANTIHGHTGSDGSTPRNRIRANGFNDRSSYENVAWDFPRVVQVVTGWMNSPGHRRNMLQNNVEEMGIGIASGPKGPQYVLVLAKKR